jgi:hypothetical protein
VNVFGMATALIGAAIALVGVIRIRAPWSRYRFLKDQDANVARYEAWRGGLRDSGTTGASVAMDILRKEIRDQVIAIGVGAFFIVIGVFVIR